MHHGLGMFQLNSTRGLSFRELKYDDDGKAPKETEFFSVPTLSAIFGLTILI